MYEGAVWRAYVGKNARPCMNVLTLVDVVQDPTVQLRSACPCVRAATIIMWQHDTLRKWGCPINIAMTAFASAVVTRIWQQWHKPRGPPSPVLLVWSHVSHTRGWGRFVPEIPRTNAHIQRERRAIIHALDSMSTLKLFIAG